MQNEIKEDYCSHKVSKLLKEKGFGVPCNYYYRENHYVDALNKNRQRIGSEERFEEGSVGEQRNNKHRGRLIDRNKYDTTTSRPTHTLAAKWIRVNFNLNIVINDYLGKYSPLVSGGKIKHWNFCDTYEEAMEEALIYALNNIKP